MALICFRFPWQRVWGKLARLTGRSRRTPRWLQAARGGATDSNGAWRPQVQDPPAGHPGVHGPQRGDEATPPSDKHGPLGDGPPQQRAGLPASWRTRTQRTPLSSSVQRATQTGRFARVPSARGASGPVEHSEWLSLDKRDANGATDSGVAGLAAGPVSDLAAPILGQRRHAAGNTGVSSDWELLMGFCGNLVDSNLFKDDCSSFLSFLPPACLYAHLLIFVKPSFSPASHRHGVVYMCSCCLIQTFILKS